jgi:annexin A7/11
MFYFKIVAFNRIFASESFDQLRMVFDEYYKLTGRQIEQAIKNEMSSSVERAFLTVGKLKI